MVTQFQQNFGQKQTEESVISVCVECEDKKSIKMGFFAQLVK